MPEASGLEVGKIAVGLFGGLVLSVAMTQAADASGQAQPLSVLESRVRDRGSTPAIFR